MIQVCISGALGFMGKCLRELIAGRADCQVACGIDARAENITSDDPIPLYPSFDAVKEKPDVIIDFSSPTGTADMLSYCEKTKTPCVVCTTGLDDLILDRMKRLAAQTAVFHSANMSLGVNLVMELAQIAAGVLGDHFDIEIIEKHHNRKVDAPSGTALMIADAINRTENGKFDYVYDRHATRAARTQHEIGFHAVRGGNIVGEHEILFCGQNETISISHSASSREVFAEGAVNAAVFLTKQAPGFYCMQDLIKQNQC
ncbi:MAG: 4-hydroxy-tetrahydrodipicolinate reductase [Oscillospiraceae bacterium]|nr:4-hydroxy-tetrahydrodipicolinate reductase [Oscillospiraceae bacterium]